MRKGGRARDCPAPSLTSETGPRERHQRKPFPLQLGPGAEPVTAQALSGHQGTQHVVTWEAENRICWTEVCAL